MTTKKDTKKSAKPSKGKKTAKEYGFFSEYGGYGVANLKKPKSSKEK